MHEANPAIVSDPPVGRRVENKKRRIARILSTARRLVQEHGSTDFTMQGLAAEAGFSLATTYNLIGTKAAVLYALLDGDLEKLRVEQAAIDAMEPVARTDAMVRLAVDFFTRDTHYFRPLMRYLLGVPEPVKRPIFMAGALQYWRYAVKTLNGHERPGAPGTLDDVARVLHVCFAGALDLWVHAECDAEQFEAQMRQSAHFVLLSATIGLDDALETMRVPPANAARTAA